jgi:hypothetical protein
VRDSSSPLCRSRRGRELPPWTRHWDHQPWMQSESRAEARTSLSDGSRRSSPLAKGLDCSGKCGWAKRRATRCPFWGCRQVQWHGDVHKPWEMGCWSQAFRHPKRAGRGDDAGIDQWRNRERDGVKSGDGRAGALLGWYVHTYIHTYMELAVCDGGLAAGHFGQVRGHSGDGVASDRTR